MPETTTTAPSQALRDLVANVTDEGLELLRRMTAFAADVRQAGRDFDAEAADLGHTAYQSALARTLGRSRAQVSKWRAQRVVAVGLGQGVGHLLGQGVQYAQARPHRGGRRRSPSRSPSRCPQCSARSATPRCASPSGRRQCRPSRGAALSTHCLGASPRRAASTTGAALSDGDGSRRYFCTDESTRCGCPRLDAERVEGRVWQEVSALLTDPERLTAMARDHLAAQAERVGRRRDDVSAVEAKIAKLERALNETVVDYAREGVPAAVVRAATDTLAGELSQLRRHRADLVRWRSAEEASDRHTKRLWALACTALDRLDTMGDGERAALLAMLAVQVTVTATSRCPQCDGRGRVGGRRGGYRCGRCRGMRTLVDLRIDGEVVDDLGDALRADGRQGDFAPMPSALSTGGSVLQSRKGRC